MVFHIESSWAGSVLVWDTPGDCFVLQEIKIQITNRRRAYLIVYHLMQMPDEGLVARKLD
jgi:hypothetical protein